MLNGQKIVVVMPAYNAARTLRQTYDEVMAHGIVDLVIVVDDASHDETVAIARTLPNVRSGSASRKSRLRREPKNLLPARVGRRRRHHHHDSSRLSVHAPVDPSDCSSCRKRSLSLCARFADPGRRRAEWWHALVEIRFKPVPHVHGEFSHRSEAFRYHTGYRAFSRQLLERLPFQTNSNDFVFDNQILAQIVALDCAIGEVTCPARYMPEASSINFRRSVRYGLGCLATAVRFRLARWGLAEPIV